MVEQNSEWVFANLDGNEQLQVLCLENAEKDGWSISETWCTATRSDRHSKVKAKVEARCLAWSLDGSRIAVICSDNSLRIYTVGCDKPEVILPRVRKNPTIDDGPLDMLFIRPDILLWLTNDGAASSYLLVAGQNGSLYTVSVDSRSGLPMGTVTCVLTGPQSSGVGTTQIASVSANFDGSKVAVAFSDGNAVYFSPQENGAPTRLLADHNTGSDTEREALLQCVTYHPLSKSALAGYDEKGTIFAWNTTSQTADSGEVCSGIYMSQNSPVTRMSWPQTDKRHVATLGADHVVRMWNLVKQQVIARFARPNASEICFVGSLALLVKSANTDELTLHKVTANGQVLAKYATGRSSKRKTGGMPVTVAMAPHQVASSFVGKENADVRASYITDKLNAILSTPHRTFDSPPKPNVADTDRTSSVTLRQSETHEALNGSAQTNPSKVSLASSSSTVLLNGGSATVAQLNDMKKELKADMQNLHVEMVRQFCIQSSETERIVMNQLAPLLESLMEEIKVLRAENQRLQSSQFL